MCCAFVLSPLYSIMKTKKHTRETRVFKAGLGSKTIFLALNIP